MKHHVVLTGLCIACFCLLSSRSPLCPQEAPGKAKLTPIEGTWIEVSIENEGTQLIIPGHSDGRFGTMDMHKPYLWKISKETIEMGSDEKDKFPQWRYTYKLNPGNQEGAIDMIPLDKDKGKKPKDKPKKRLALYFVKDDYLMICIGRDSRPKTFTTSKDNPNSVYLLRRTKAKSTGPDSDKPKRKDK